MACIRAFAALLILNVGMAVTSSMALIGVDLNAPVISRKAWFWTLSSMCWLDVAVVIHVEEPYSIWGLTVPRYTVFSMVLWGSQFVPVSFRSIASLSRAFASGFAMWGFHVSLLSKVTPRYVASSMRVRGVPQMFMVEAFCLVDRVNRVVDDFSVFTCTHQSSAHADSLSAACCILKVAVDANSSEHHITRSSA